MSEELVQVSLAFKKDNPEKSVSFGTNAVDCIKNGIEKKIIPDAAAMPLPVDTLDGTTTELNTLVAKALNGTYSVKSALKKQLTVWRSQFSKTAKFINGLANGDAETIEELGFVATSGTRKRKQKPAQITDFVASINGKKGTIIARAKKGVNATAYGYVVAPQAASIAFADNTVAVTVGGQTVYFMVCTRRKAEFYDMPGQQQFNVCMFGVNAAGSGPASDIQDVTPQ